MVFNNFFRQKKHKGNQNLLDKTTSTKTYKFVEKDFDNDTLHMFCPNPRILTHAQITDDWDPLVSFTLAQD